MLISRELTIIDYYSNWFRHFVEVLPIYWMQFRLDGFRCFILYWLIKSSNVILNTIGQSQVTNMPLTSRIKPLPICKMPYAANTYRMTPVMQYAINILSWISYILDITFISRVYYGPLHSASTKASHYWLTSRYLLRLRLLLIDAILHCSCRRTPTGPEQYSHSDILHFIFLSRMSFLKSSRQVCIVLLILDDMMLERYWL